MCPATYKIAYRNGKNTYASIAYEMTVTHSKKLQATTIGHFGTASDRTIVKFDGLIRRSKTEKLFLDAEYEFQIGPKKWIREKGIVTSESKGEGKSKSDWLVRDENRRYASNFCKAAQTS